MMRTSPFEMEYVSKEHLVRARALFESIRQWDHWDEIALGAQKEYALTPEQFQQRLSEYQRFMSLCATFSGIGMCSRLVDELWHAHILNTQRYQAFCMDVLGQMVHHLPCSSYILYGVDPASADDDCTTCQLPSIPTTCYGKRMPDDGASQGHGAIRQSILLGGQRFVQAYLAVFGHAPDPDIWERVPLHSSSEGIAVL